MDKITITNLSNSGLDVQGIIEKLMELKRKPIDILKNDNDLYSKRIEKLNKFIDLLKKLQDASKAMYDYRSPFNEMKATSSDENILTADAERIAEAGVRKIKVIQVAKSLRIVSDLLNVKDKIGRVAFTVTSGKKTKKIVFNGGSLEEFIKTLKREAGDILRINVTYKDKNHVYITFESKEPGKNNILQFSNEVMPVLERLGFYVKAEKAGKKFSLKDFAISVNRKDIFKNGTFILNQNDYVKIDLKDKLKGSYKATLKFKVEKLLYTPPQPKKLNIPEDQLSPGELSYENITVEADPIYKDQLVETKKQIKAPLKILVKGTEGQKIIEVADPSKEVVLDKDKLGIGDITEVYFENPSSDKYKISDISATTQERTINGYAPKHVLQRAQNSIIEVDGVRVEKSTDKISDVIKGVTLNLKNASDKEITLTIDHDFDYIKDQIIKWVGLYNNVIDFIVKETDTDKGKDGKPKGAFVGDISFMLLHNNLQKMVASFYRTPDQLKMLAQIGISTGKPGNTPQDRGGYLEIDEQMLDKAIKERPLEIKKLFGFDSNKDLIPDNGVGVRLYNLLRGMTNAVDGTFRQRVRYFNTLIDMNKKNIESLERSLEDYKAMLMYKFSVMEQIVSSLKSQGDYLMNVLQYSSSSSTGSSQSSGK